MPREGRCRPSPDGCLNRPWARHGQWTSHGPQCAFKMSMFMCPAVHIPTRSWLRSSSTPEPSDPLYSVMFFHFASWRTSRLAELKKAMHTVSHPLTGKGLRFKLTQGRGILRRLAISFWLSSEHRTQDASHRRPGGPWQSTPGHSSVPAARRRARGAQVRAPPESLGLGRRDDPESVFLISSSWKLETTNNDPSAGSPTETLLRLLLPLNAQVWESFQRNAGANLQSADPNTSLKRSIGSSDGRCVQRAGT